MNCKLKVVSLFSGIGGFEEGLNKSKINYEVVFSSEIDVFAQKSYLANFKNNNLHGDITLINEKEIPNHDLLVAGFPCQSFSIAGKQKGFDDVRGTLFFDIVRILIEKKPKYILLENVKNLISHNNGKTIRVILSKLNSIGYVVDVTIINSLESGVPQNRERTYICGIYNGKNETLLNDIRSSKIDNLKKEFNLLGIKGFNFFNNLTFNNKQMYINDILEDEVAETFYFNSDKIKFYLNSQSISDILECQTKIVKLFDLPRDVHNDLERQRRVYSIKGISPTVLARTDTTKLYIETQGTKKIRKVTPTENFLIQGFDKQFVENIKNTGMSYTQMYKQSGNAVSPPVITGIFNQLYKEFICNV